jgi:hypothetical protein
MHLHQFLRFTHSRLDHIANDANPMDNGVDMHCLNFVQELNFSDIQQRQQQQQRRQRQ